MTGMFVILYYRHFIDVLLIIIFRVHRTVLGCIVSFTQGLGYRPTLSTHTKYMTQVLYNVGPTTYVADGGPALSRH